VTMFHLEYLVIWPILMLRKNVWLSLNKLVFLGYNEDLKVYKLRDPKNKEFISSRHVTLDEASMMKPIVPSRRSQ